MSAPGVTEAVRRNIDERSLLRDGQRVVVGVSGGIDSVVLVHVLRDLGYDIVMAHVNYGLRGEESDDDEAFVRDLALGLGREPEVMGADARGRAKADGYSVQAAARAIRYEHFVDVANKVGARSVAVAHHAEDQAETVLMNLLRGSGPEGLAGMRVERSLAPGIRLVRPMLFARRSDIEAFAADRGLKWREDESNLSDKYRRGRFRHQILPQIQQVLPDEDVVRGINRSASFMRAYERTTHRREVKRLFERARLDDGRRGLTVATLADIEPTWQSRVLLRAVRRWIPSMARRTVVAELRNLLPAQAGRSMTFGGVTVWRERDALVFEAPQEHGFVEASIETWSEPRRVPGGAVVVHRASGDVDVRDPDPLTEYVPADRLTFPLKVRLWKPGDVMTPFGMSGRKKISDVLTDAGVPTRHRAATLVLESEGEIVWLVGVRLSEAFRVESQVQSVAKLSFIPDESSISSGS
jgi:tRNA(Ile)-lysidine synthase